MEPESEDSDDDFEEAEGHDEVPPLEPQRTAHTSPSLLTDEMDEDNEMTEEYHVAKRLRGGVEDRLSRDPIVVKFPLRSAGMTYPSPGSQTPNEQYRADLGNLENSYAPFSSKLDWDIAKWAKMRGPSSTAFTELMKIEGVVEKLGLTFSNTRELNKIIDGSLPGRPQFKRHEIVVGDEVCEVFWRDIIACIKALLGDPDFAGYLAIVPEKHYVDEGKTTRLYHDMHTGKWWWSMQSMVTGSCRKRQSGRYNNPNHYINRQNTAHALSQ
ncbi:hypothetical protein H0H93_004526 [Arthromyces matolae]|nr:hypothetical protein H0H93_004526 [Arthromyces matolae]